MAWAEREVIEMSLLKKAGEGLRYVLAFLLLTVVFFSAFYLAWDSRPADAGVMAGLFIVFLIAFNFSGIESFKAFSIEVKRIQDTIYEAQATLDQLKKLALSSAHNQFFNLSTAGRWGGGDLEPKEKLARDLNKFLASMEVDASDVADARAPYIDMIRTDLFNVMRNVITQQYREAVQPVLDEVNTIRPRIVDGVNMHDADRKPLMDRAADIGSAMAYLKHGIPSEHHFYDVMQAQIFRQKLGEERGMFIEAIGSHLLRMYDEAKKEGNLTDEGLEFLLMYAGSGGKDQRGIKQSKYAARCPINAN